MNKYPKILLRSYFPSVFTINLLFRFARYATNINKQNAPTAAPVAKKIFDKSEWVCIKP